MAICQLCGDQIEDPSGSGICYGCHLASLLPAGYEEAEKYEHDYVWGHDNATRRPISCRYRVREVAHAGLIRTPDDNSLRDFYLWGLCAHGN